MNDKTLNMKPIKLSIGQESETTTSTNDWSLDPMSEWEQKWETTVQKVIHSMTLVSAAHDELFASLYHSNKRLRSNERPIAGDTQENPDLKTIRIR